MFLVVAQGTGVLDIFYDVLALQFLQVLDDIAFRLAKLSTFGKRLKWATNKKIFLVEFDRLPFASRKKMSVFLKSLYVLNLSAMVSGMFWVSYQQMSGSLHCNSVFVTFAEVSNFFMFILWVLVCNSFSASFSILIQRHEGYLAGCHSENTFRGNREQSFDLFLFQWCVG